ncbi:excalibur calcium-binding domain-containing protein [Aliiglaciecola sp. LCG003]|uniref:excalibur calcium-binding domain-containing protein n=1 Tax=Aliiglaciecola sp. LCG003 TaxID=3053655 RepID=UPI0025747019|nr:excalibur calcium-binding domain-containing protein [Aliiglaciecola sp. LCG003]WJG08072.1 excalibur calcium-binding domain-containing protein [Aliiglaciecola sp. LCG003]
MYKGQLTKWDDARGFGFIKTAELNHDTFIHISELNDMSRKPRTGDFIYFNVEQVNGKKRATNARIEGVKSRTQPKLVKNYKPRSNLRFLYVAVLIVIVAVVIQRLDLLPKKAPLIPAPYSTQFVPEQTFSCDGRQHCSQMTSRAEAEYFLENCPNTKMDGDRDGIPCENDSRF